MIPRGAQPWRLAALGEALQLPFRGDPDWELRAARDLSAAGEHDLAALYDSRYVAEAEVSKAGALIVPAKLATAWPDRNVLWSPAPKAAFARAIELLHPVLWPAPGIDGTARIAASATIDSAATIGPYVTIGERCEIGPRSVVGAGAVLLDDVTLGEGVQIHPRVVLYPGTLVEDHAIVFAGAVIGAPGFGHAIDAENVAVSQPHLGRVVVSVGAEVGANSTIDRATFGETRLEAGARIDNLVQIGHNSRVGRQAMIAAQCGLSGGSSLGDGAIMGGQSGIGPQIAVGAGAAVAAKTAVLQDVGAGEVVAGNPALPMARWRRIVAIEARLPEWWREWRALRAGGAVAGAERGPDQAGRSAGEE